MEVGWRAVSCGKAPAERRGPSARSQIDDGARQDEEALASGGRRRKTPTPNDVSARDILSPTLRRQATRRAIPGQIFGDGWRQTGLELAVCTAWRGFLRRPRAGCIASP